MLIFSRRERQKTEEYNIRNGFCSFNDIVLSAARNLEKQITEDSVRNVVIACGNGRIGMIGQKLAELLSDKPEITVKVISAEVYPSETIQKIISTAEYVVDCIWGYQEPAEAEHPYDSWIDWINESDCYVLSCEIPSGINCDNGAEGNHCIKADATVVCGIPFRGLYLYPGNTLCGKLIYSETILNTDTVSPETISYDYNEIRKMLPVRHVHSHKGDYGRVLLIGGHDNTVGACIMCGRMILKSGAGLLTIMSYPETVRTAHEVLPEAMTITINAEEIDRQLDELNTDNYSLIVFGPGAGREEITEKLLVYVLNQNRDVILDADGLYYLKKHIELLDRGNLTVITPHLGEYSRIFDYSQDSIIPDLMSISEKYPNLITVLKSENTLTAYRSKVTVNRTGNNALAKGGSGDVLCGLTAGLFAQKPDISSVTAAVYIHSLAADYWIKENSSYSLLASDLILQIEKILFEMTK